MMVRIVAPHFTAGMVRGGACAPILHYMRAKGWTLRQIRAYCHDEQGWTMELIDDEKPEYVECRGGWATLYRPLIERCEREGYTVGQVKQKFGSMRFYVDLDHAAGETLPPELELAIAIAERASQTVCEWCGGPAKLREHCHYLFTACDTHHREVISERDARR